MKCKIVFFLYVFTTLFVGTSVQQFLGIDLGSEGVIARSHYIALPFLLISYFINARRIKFIGTDIKLFFLLIFFGSVNIFVLRKSAGFSGFFNFIIEPVLLLSLLRISDNKTIWKIQKFVLVFFVVECTIAVFEAVTKTILFADNRDYILMSADMRAYSLHGHPLQNAFLVGIISTVILTSNMKILPRYAFFFLGYLAIFSFNTRSSVYLLALILIISVFYDIKSSRIKKKHKWIFMIGLIFVFCLFFNYIETNTLGTRMSVGLTKEDSSSYARFVLIDVIRSMNIEDLLFGVSNDFVASVMNKNGLIAIENSIVNLIFINGLIFTCLFLLLMFLELKHIIVTKYMFNMTMFLTFVLLNANNALTTTCPIVPILILGLYSFRNINSINLPDNKL